MTEIEKTTILNNYPEFISKDQMSRICKISKRTCLHLLESGAVPCVDTGKKTHRFHIRIYDVIAYLEDREVNPEKYAPPAGYYKRKPEEFISPYELLSEEDLDKMRAFYMEELEDYPEVMSVDDISSFSGYGSSAVRYWCFKNKVEFFQVGQKYFVPREYLVDFFLTPFYINKTEKSPRHKEFLERLEASDE